MEEDYYSDSNNSKNEELSSLTNNDDPCNMDGDVMNSTNADANKSSEDDFEVKHNVGEILDLDDTNGLVMV